mmetsp:Transcript_30707/g.68877  ORF Transcript_30707/g.68877 Transcript_30707/m.68877 type:complete len:211 (-) Transcript_30707:111-743(-)
MGPLVAQRIRARCADPASPSSAELETSLEFEMYRPRILCDHGTPAALAVLAGPVDTSPSSLSDKPCALPVRYCPRTLLDQGTLACSSRGGGEGSRSLAPRPACRNRDSATSLKEARGHSSSSDRGKYCSRDLCEGTPAAASSSKSSSPSVRSGSSSVTVSAPRRLFVKLNAKSDSSSLSVLLSAVVEDIFTSVFLPSGEWYRSFENETIR